MLRITALALVVVCGIILGGCGGSDDNGPQPSPAPPGLALKLNVNSPVAAGQSVRLELVLRNSGEPTVKIDLPGDTDNGFEGSVDFFVTGPGNRQVWDWSHGGGAVQAVVQVVTLVPGQQMTIDREWDRTDNQGQVVPPGTYHVFGTLKGNTEQRTDFSLTSETEELDIS